MKERVKAVRKNLKMTQQAFADELHVARNYITLIETGSSPVTDKFLYNVCSTFHVNEEWLRTGEGEMFKTLDRESEVARIADIMLREIEPSVKNTLIRMVADASEDQLQLLVDSAKKFVENLDDKETPAE